jgi:hypothetical protein
MANKKQKKKGKEKGTILIDGITIYKIWSKSITGY